MNITIPELRVMQAALDPIEFQYTFTSNGIEEIYVGSMILTSIDEPATASANVEYSCNGQGTGELININGS